MRRAWLFGMVALAVGLLVGAGMMEGALRVYAAINPSFGTQFKAFDPTIVQIEPHGTMGYRQRPNSVLHYFNGTTATSNSLGYRGPEVPVQPPPGTVRIILLGGSTTHGYGVSDDQTIDAHMRTIFHERDPARHFEVVNLALDGYDTYQLLQRLQSDGLPLHPTVVVLNTGINDVRSAWFPNLREADPRSMLWTADLARLQAERDRGGPTVWTRTKHYSFVARLPGFIREQLARRRELRERTGTPPAGSAAKTARVADSSGHGPPYPDAAAFFERHVREMVNLSLQQGAAVLLSTPPSALRSYPSGATSQQNYWVIDAKTTQDYRDLLAAKLRAIDSDERANGHAVRYIAPVVALPFFLDDCHLKGDGNRVVAQTLVDAILPMVQTKPDSARRSAAR